jgi:hypothetical protein
MAATFAPTASTWTWRQASIHGRLDSNARARCSMLDSRLICSHNRYSDENRQTHVVYCTASPMTLTPTPTPPRLRASALNHLVSGAHVLGASAAIVAGSLLLIISLWIGAASIAVILGLPLIVGGALYLLALRRVNGEMSLIPSGGIRLAKFGSVVFVVSVSAASLLFQETALRPDAYFFLMGIAATGVLLQARGAQTNSRVLMWAIIQALVLAALLRGHALFESPALTMSDIGAHKSMILAWQEAGQLMHFHPVYETWYGYYDWPFLHLCVITTLLLTGLSFNAALFIAVGLPFVAAILFVYLIAATLMNRTAGIMAVIFTSGAAAHIWWGAVLIPTSMGVTLFCGITYVVMVWRNSLPQTLVFLLLGLALVLTHTASAFITLGAVFAITVTSHFAGNAQRRHMLAPTVSLLLLVTATLSRWISGYHAPGLTFFQMVTGGIIDSAIEVAAPTANLVYSANQEPLNSLWLGFTAAMFTTGALVCLHPAERSPRRVAGLAVVAVLCGVVVGFPLLGMRNVLPHRWLPFIFAGGAWLAVLSVSYVSRMLNHPLVHVYQVTVMAIFVALSLFTTSAHPRTPLSSVPVPLSWTASEAAAGNTIARWTPTIATVDTYYKGLADGLPAGQTISWHPLSTTVQPLGLITVRHAVRDTMHETGIGTCQAGQRGNNPQETLLFASLERHPYSRVYESSKVSAFLASARA